MDPNTEWTHVASKKKGKSNRAPTQPASHDNRPPPPSCDVTLDQLLADFAAKSRIWRSSNGRRELLRLLNFMRPNCGWKAGRAVCLGSGSFSRENAVQRRRGLWQLTVFVDVARWLGEQSRGGEEEGVVKLAAQEPHYTDLDLEFLGSLGVEVLECEDFGNAEALEGMETEKKLGPARNWFGETTFVCEFFIHYDWWTCGPFVQGANAAMISTVRRHLIDPPFARSHGTKLAGLQRELDKRYKNYHFPRFESDPNVFEGLDVFGLQPDEDD